jgi:hypothetical protein
MSKTRWLAVFVLPLLLVSFLQSQSLAELAKKEKERRAALKGKPATVITTADLAKVKKRPAVETTTQERVVEEVAAEEIATPPGAGQEAEAGAAGAAEAAADPVVAEGEAAAKPIETLPDLQNPAPPNAKDIQARIAELTKAANEKQELVELLNLKMNALYQEFYNMESLKSREILQAQISDTYDKLLKTQLDATRAVKELDDFVAQAQKDKTPVIWIK